MATVRAICTDAAREIGMIGFNDTLSAVDAALCLLRFQNQLDAWQAESLTLAVNAQLTFTIPGGTQTFTIGPTGDIVAQRPVWIEAMTYVIPGTSPEVETIMAPMNDDQYDVLSIKALESSLPTQFYYNTSFSTLLGSMFVWPMPDQNIKVYVYVKQGPGVPIDLNSIVLGPAGYAEAFMYGLAERLLTPAGVGDASVIARVMRHATESLARVKRANNTPGLLGVDAALVPTAGGSYNVLNDTNTGYYGGR